MSLAAELTNRIKDAEKALAEAHARRNYHETAASLIDALEMPPGVKLESSNLSTWWKTGFVLYLTTKAFPALIPLLEQVETTLGAEFTSKDLDSGVRVFNLLQWPAEPWELGITLYVTPAVDSPDATCHKVLIGEDTETVTRKTPRYRIQCD